jgi:hypothetical protein
MYFSLLLIKIKKEITFLYMHCFVLIIYRGRIGRDPTVVGFTTTCAISAYPHWRCELEPRLWWGAHDTTLCDKVCQWLATGRWFAPNAPVSSTNKADCHDISEILLKVALNTITSTLQGTIGKVWRYQR